MFTHSVADTLNLPSHTIQTTPPSRPEVPRPPESICGLFDVAPQRNIRAHEQLFREGEPRSQVYLVTQGAFVLYRLLANGRRQVTGFASTGDVLGLGAVSRHLCTAEASSAAKVRGLAANVLSRAARTDAEFGLHLYQAVSHELEAIQDLLLTVGRLDAGQRVATFLLGLSVRNDREGHRQDPINLPMTRCDIGDYLGLTTETVSRTITKLVNRGTVARVGGAIRVLDETTLSAIAIGDETL